MLTANQVEMISPVNHWETKDKVCPITELFWMYSLHSKSLVKAAAAIAATAADVGWNFY